MVCRQAPFVAGHNRSDHVYQLSQAGDLYTVRVAEHGDQHLAYQQGVLKVVNILQLAGRLGPALDLLSASWNGTIRSIRQRTG